ncbi:MAG TPA: HAD family hydrolase [Longimicrobiales bacterium]|nr:HAD family hydrolase [Longimicrobiales bacterium]
MRMPQFDIIALDADDTLWHNERLFSETQVAFSALLAKYVDSTAIENRLYEIERRNLRHFGYGVKGFVLSMIETAIEITHGEVRASDVQQLISFGRAMLDAQIELLPGVQETVEELAKTYKLMLVTKGDLFDQETKLARSGLGEHFSAIEIVSEKDVKTYLAIIHKHGVKPDRFLMVGNSLKSDVLPVLQAGAAAVHVPHELTWLHEQIDEKLLEGHQFARLATLSELIPWLASS